MGIIPDELLAMEGRLGLLENWTVREWQEATLSLIQDLRFAEAWIRRDSPEKREADLSADALRMAMFRRLLRPKRGPKKQTTLANLVRAADRKRRGRPRKYTIEQMEWLDQWTKQFPTDKALIEKVLELKAKAEGRSVLKVRSENYRSMANALSRYRNSVSKTQMVSGKNSPDI